MASIGIRELKNNLSRYVRRAEGGTRVSVTAHGRVVAELVSPSTNQAVPSRLRALIDQGIVTPPREGGNPLPRVPGGVRLPKGTAAKWLAEDRDDS
jgi:prevent-host-death family protein